MAHIKNSSHWDLRITKTDLHAKFGVPRPKPDCIFGLKTVILELIQDPLYSVYSV